ncbi:glycosyltransferase family 4 protein [Alloacidobacterium dinghuense]|uniref:Glycosyltransferase family 4 protein n=1 Tax=Alloacidobacterium dinghuense TaxID=2763107 RepID=A0A7G8BKK0_9BACT|nr:glycosyltransferase family 4 protein [Alloacidobacterium dinghuense]QNI33070.1 glycosyltransferase family 4 protein [Alloacidobacterium dinghuense]
MNILMLHNSYQFRGGEDESYESEVRMLRSNGHSIETIHMDYAQMSAKGKIQVALESLWSTPSYKLVDRMLQERKFDVLHVQNFFPLLSPSVYYAAKKHGVAVVQTLRNYRLLCPSVFFYRDGRPCEDCIDKAFKYPGILHGCYRGSRAATAAVAAMTALHTMRGTWLNAVDIYIALTKFVRDKFIQAGFPEQKLVVKSNFVYPDPGCGDGKGDYALFVGRLSPEKGLDTLLQAWRQLNRNWKLKVVGDGPMANDVRAFCAANANVEWVGSKSRAETAEMMGNARLLVFPSQWYETFGRVAMESFAAGTPVIASRLGAMAEVCEDGQAGMLFETGNAADLADKLRWVFDHPAEAKAMRSVARQVFEARYTMPQNYCELIDIYQAAERACKGEQNGRGCTAA